MEPSRSQLFVASNGCQTEQCDKLPPSYFERGARPDALTPVSARRARAASYRSLLKCPIPKTIQKAPSGVRTSLPAANGIAAFAVTASCTRRWYANTLLTSIRRQCRRVCTSTSTVQFGSERNLHDHALKSLTTRCGRHAVESVSCPHLLN